MSTSMTQRDQAAAARCGVTSYKTQAASPLGHRSAIVGALLQYPDIIYWQGTEKFCMLATLAHLEHLFVRFI